MDIYIYNIYTWISYVFLIVGRKQPFLLRFVALTAREGDITAVDATMLLDIAAAEKGKPQLLTDGVGKLRGPDGMVFCIVSYFFVSSRCLNDFLLCPARDPKIYLCFAVNKGCFGRWRRCSAIGSRLKRSGGSVVGFQAVSVLLFIFFCQSFAHDFLRPQRFLHTNSWALWNKGITKRTTSPGEYCDSCSLVGHAWTACSSPHSPELFSARLPCGKGPKRSGKILSIGGHVEVQDFCSSKGNRLNRLWLFHTVTISKYWHEK